jgi:hypothetical protein
MRRRGGDDVNHWLTTLPTVAARSINRIGLPDAIPVRLWIRRAIGGPKTPPGLRQSPAAVPHRQPMKAHRRGRRRPSIARLSVASRQLPISPHFRTSEQ